MTWSKPVNVPLPRDSWYYFMGTYGFGLEMGQDTMIRPSWSMQSLFISHDGGYGDWHLKGGLTPMAGIDPDYSVLDDGSVLFFNRDDQKYTDVTAKFTVKGLPGTAVTTLQERSPFSNIPLVGGHAGHIGMVKLYSGRLIRVTRRSGSGTIISESVDQGRTWFCR